MAGAAPVQTQEDLVPPAPAAIGYRLAGVLLAAPVALAVHVILAGPVGLDLQVPESPGSSQLRELDFLTTTLVTLGISLVGWLLVRVLEGSLGGERGRRIWMLVAVGVFVASLIAIAVLDVPMATRWGLFALHLAVAVVLIPTLSSSTPAAHPVAGGWVDRQAEAAAAQEDTHASPATASGHGHADAPEVIDASARAHPTAGDQTAGSRPATGHDPQH